MLLRSSRKSPDHLKAVRRVKEWTRERFKLSDEDAISVSEVACTVPGCAPLETVIAFWIGEKRHHFKVFKPVSETVMDDLPPAWMKNSLDDPDGAGCDCC